MNRQRKTYLLLIAIIICFSVDMFSQNDTIRAKNFLRAGVKLYYDGDYLKAEKKLLKAEKLREKIFGANHQKLASVNYRLGKTKGKLREHPAALFYLNRALQIEKNNNNEEEKIGDLNLEIGHIYNQMYDIINADIHYNKGLEIYKDIHGPESIEVGNMLMNFANTAVKHGKYYDANQYFEKVFDIFNISSKQNDVEFYRLYNNWGLLHRKIDNLETALAYAKKALEIKSIHYESTHPSVAKYHRNIARVYQDMGAYEKAKSSMQNTIDIFEKTLGKNHSELGGAYGEMANILTDLEEYNAAIIMIKKSNIIQGKTLPIDHPYLTSGILNLGQTYEQKGDFKTALENYQLAYKNASGQKNPSLAYLAKIKIVIAKNKAKNGLYLEALEEIQNAIFHLTDSRQLNSTTKIIQSEAYYLDALYVQSRIYEDLYETDNKTSTLQKSVSSSEKAVKFISQIKNGLLKESGLNYLIEESNSIYQAAIRQNFTLYERTNDIQYLNAAFEYTEQNKSSILWKNLNGAYALQASGISADDMSKLDSLKNHVQVIEKSIATNDVNKYDSLTSQKLQVELNYSKFIKEIENKYPKYKNQKTIENTYSVKELKSKLESKNGLIIEYNYYKNDLYVFTLSKEKITGKKIKIDFDLKKSIFDMRQNNLNSILLDQSIKKDYIETVGKLYAVLIQPIDEILKQHEKITIIPHDVLQYLSFDVLAPNSTHKDFRKLNYLIKTHTIQYAWSAALYLFLPQNEQINASKFSGFAPFYKPVDLPLEKSKFRNNLGSLQNSFIEITAANKYFKGNLYEDKAASKQAFLESAPSSSIIHLATHAFANDQSPKESGLLFASTNEIVSDDFLTLLEIYNLNLSADLAVMSACNTGYGKLTNGEGVISLGRGFIHAGCKSIIMSLWPANDQSTSTIIQKFYKYLSTGMNKDNALRAAKIDYLSSADALTAHPYFWANLVAVGDMRPLKNKKYNYLWYFLIFPLAYLLYFKKQKQRQA